MSAKAGKGAQAVETRTLVREKELEAIRLLGEICELRSKLEARDIADYPIRLGGGSRPLSSCFTRHAQLLLIHNMGVDCHYCATYADGINGILSQIERLGVHVLLVSNDPFESLAGFAGDRGWKIPVGSVRGTSFSRDLDFEPSPGDLWPGICALRRSVDRIELENRYCFEPGDHFSPFWPLQTFLGRDDREPGLSGPGGDREA